MSRESSTYKLQQVQPCFISDCKSLDSPRRHEVISQVSPCEICGGRSGTGTGFRRNTSVFAVSINQPCYSFLFSIPSTFSSHRIADVTTQIMLRDLSSINRVVVSCVINLLHTSSRSFSTALCFQINLCASFSVYRSCVFYKEA